MDNFDNFLMFDYENFFFRWILLSATSIGVQQFAVAFGVSVFFAILIGIVVFIRKSMVNTTLVM